MSILSSLWNDFLTNLQQTDVKIPVLYSLLKQLKPISLADNKLTLGCSNTGMRFFLEKRKPEIEALFYSLLNKKLRLNSLFMKKNPVATLTPPHY